MIQELIAGVDVTIDGRLQHGGHFFKKLQSYHDVSILGRTQY